MKSLITLSYIILLPKKLVYIIITLGVDAMKSRNLNYLYENLRQKGIQVGKGDRKYIQNYSYYQIINAYKPLFIRDVKTIDDIYDDLINGRLVNKYLEIYNKKTIQVNLHKLSIMKSVNVFVNDTMENTNQNRLSN